VWQEAKALCAEVTPILDRIPQKDANLRHQVDAASVSTMSNIAEGFTRQSRREFNRFVDIATASNAEVRSLFHVLEQRGYATPPELAALLRRTDSIGRMLRRLAQSLARPRPVDG
jgi:four helix bundle protein